MNETARNQFFELIQTTDDVENLTDSFALCLKSIFSTKINSPLELINELLPSKIAQVVSEAITEAHIDPMNTGAIKQTLELFLDALKALEEVSITLSLDPPQKTIDDLSQAVKESFGQNAIISLNVDPGILGGAVIIYQGRYLDYSLKRKLSILFEARKAEIMTMIKD